MKYKLKGELKYLKKLSLSSNNKELSENGCFFSILFEKIPSIVKINL